MWSSYLQFLCTDPAFSPETTGEGIWQRKVTGRHWALEPTARVHPHGTVDLAVRGNSYITSLILIVFICKIT